MYKDFGEYLLSHLKIDVPKELDWKFIIGEYNKRIKKKQRPGLVWINWVVCTYFGIDPVEVRTVKTNAHTHTIPKHISIYLATELFGHDGHTVGVFYNVKNRSSVSNSRTSVINKINSDKNYRLDVEIITNKLLGHEENKNTLSDSIGIPNCVQKSGFKTGNNMSLDRDR